MDLYGYTCPVSALNNPQELIAQRPRYYSQERAEEEVHTILLQYVQRWFPAIFARIPQGELLLLTPSAPCELTNRFLWTKPVFTDGQKHWPTFNARDGDHDLDLLAHSMSKMFHVNTDSHDSLSLDLLADSFGRSVKLDC